MKIISTPVDNGGCGFLRIRQPLRIIKETTDHDTHVINPHEDDMTAVADALKHTDIILSRPGGEQGIKQLLNTPEYKEKPWVLDIDDNLTEISPYSPHYGDYGIEEFYDKNNKLWIWKDGESINIKENKEKRYWHEWALKTASLVTTSTERLANYAKQFNKNVAVLPNSLDLDSWWHIETKPHKQLRAIWSGGASHFEDWFSIKKPLNDLMRKYQFKLIMVGSDFSGVIDEDNKKLVEFRPWVPFEAHSYHMMALDADFAIIPLADLPFNKYKSSVKWYEMSAMGIPSVVSWVAPYSDDVPNDCALGYKDSQSFSEAVLSLLQSQDVRKNIGEKARKWVENNRNAKTTAKMWINAYQSIISSDN